MYKLCFLLLISISIVTAAEAGRDTAGNDSVIYVTHNDTLEIETDEGYDSGTVYAYLPVISLVAPDPQISAVVSFSESIKLQLRHREIALPYMLVGPYATIFSTETELFGENSSESDRNSFPDDLIPFSDPYYEEGHKLLINSEVDQHPMFGEQVYTYVEETHDLPFYAKDSSGRHYKFQIRQFDTVPDTTEHDENYGYQGNALVLQIHWMADSSGNGVFVPGSSNPGATNIKEKKSIHSPSFHVSSFEGGLSVQSLHSDSRLSLKLFDGRGRLIQNINGNSKVRLNFESISAGSYIMQISNASEVKSVKIMIP